jgi:D-glycero-alpha-D-manno-heptose-7-phosphate kinase
LRTGRRWSKIFSMIVESRAPNRILDLGGWTDTHFAQTGRVLNFAVSLFARATLRTRRKPGIAINAVDYGDRFQIDDLIKASYGTQFDLLLAAAKKMPVKQGLDITISADVPPGCGTGSSAAISVALLLSLARLAGKALSPGELARLAHSIETEELGLESGIQDQVSASYGGINFIEIEHYPQFLVSPLKLSPELVFELESSLLLVYEGRGHLSSDVHKSVIERMRAGDKEMREIFCELAHCAEKGKQALLLGRLELLADATAENHQLQKRLHPEINTARFKEIEKLSRGLGAVAVKINGAGGGGSMSIIAAPGKRPGIERALKEKGFRVLNFTIAFQPASAWVCNP